MSRGIVANADVKSTAVGSGVKLWEIAAEMGIPDSSLSRKLRHELVPDEKERIFFIIEQIRRGKGGARTCG